LFTLRNTNEFKNFWLNIEGVFRKIFSTLLRSKKDTTIDFRVPLAS
jgi:hypothetical protein